MKRKKRLQTVRRTHLRQGKIVRQHPLIYWSWRRDSPNTEIVGWRKGSGEKLGVKVGGVGLNKKFNAGNVLRRLEAGENIHLTPSQRKGVEAYQQKVREKKSQHNRMKREYARLVAEGRAW